MNHPPPVEATAAESVLYQLLRDGDVSPSRIESLVLEAEAARNSGSVSTNGFVLSNAYVALYAKEIIHRLEVLAQ